MKPVQYPARLSLVALSLLVLSACSTLQPQLPEDLASTAQLIQAGDSAASKRFVSDIESRVQEFERNGEWYQAVQLTSQGLRILPDHPRLNALYQSAESQLETARLHLEWERLIGETRQQLNQRELLQGEHKLRPASEYRDWQLARLNKSLEASAEKLRQCGLQSMESRQWHYAEDCLVLAAHIRGHDFVEKELGALKQAKADPVPTVKTTNTLQERRLAAAFNQALKQQDFGKARAALSRLQQLNIMHTDISALQKQLAAATDQHIAELEEQAAEHYRNQEYQLAREKWQAILKLQPSHQQATERLKRVDKVLQSLEELQSGTDKP